jgi:hypothetical protein
MAINWIQEAEELSPAALTVRAQALSPNDRGQLLWDVFFPRRNVDSVNLNDIVTLDDRPAADRREWNARGRYIPVRTPTRRQMSIVPIEAYDKIEEQEMQRVAEAGLSANAETFRRLIGVRIPDRTDRLAMSDYRRLELDCFTAWATGTIVQRNPQDASKTVTASYGFDVARMQTATPAWNDGSVNAYNEFLAWYQDGEDAVGAGAGAMLRRATLNAILADAPNLGNSVAMTLAGLEQRVQDDLGRDFRFFINENSVDVFTDGGTAVTRTKVWPAEQVAFVPAGQVVGDAVFAPVVRAMEISGQVPGAGVDVRGVTIYHDAANAGRELTIEAQLNAAPRPDEQRVFVIDAGV